MGAPGSPHPPRRPTPPSCMHPCSRTRTHADSTRERTHLHTHLHTHHPHTRPPFDSLPGAEPSGHKDSGSYKLLTGLPKLARGAQAVWKSDRVLEHTWGENTHRSCLSGTRNRSQWYMEFLAGNPSENTQCWAEHSRYAQIPAGWCADVSSRQVSRKVGFFYSGVDWGWSRD